MKNNRKCERCSILNCEQLLRFHCYLFMRLALLDSNRFKAWTHITVKFMRQALTCSRRLLLFVILYQISEIDQRYQWRYHCYINIVAFTTHYEAQLFIVIKKFRHNIRLKKTKKKKVSAFNSTFVADENKENNKFRNNKFKSSRNISFQDNIKLIFICICD